MINANASVRKMSSAPSIKSGTRPYACVLPTVLTISIVLQVKHGVKPNVAVSARLSSATILKFGTQLLASANVLLAQAIKLVLALLAFPVQ